MYLGQQQLTFRTDEFTTVTPFFKEIKEACDEGLKVAYNKKMTLSKSLIVTLTSMEKARKFQVGRWPPPTPCFHTRLLCNHNSMYYPDANDVAIKANQVLMDKHRKEKAAHGTKKARGKAIVKDHLSQK
jgi:hypothetical protein